MTLKGMAERICGISVLLLALWTVLCNLAVWLGLSLDLLITAFLVCLLGLAIVVLSRRLTGRSSLNWLREPESSETLLEPAPQRIRRFFESDSFRVACAVLGAAGAVLIFALRQDPSLLALAGIVLLLGALVSTYRRPRQATRPHAWGNFVLPILAVLLVVLTLAAHRPDADDCFYVNVAARAVENPHAPFLQHDGIFGIPDQPVVLPGYRVQSWEPLAAAISRITKIAPILALHWILASLAAFLAPFAISLLTRKLLPRFWLPATGLVIALLLCMGDAHSSYGNFSFIRMQQGKSALVTVAIPLIAAYALRFGQRPTRGNAVLLFASQIMAVGMNFSAIFLAPTVAWLSLLGAWDRRPDRRLLLGVAASLYPLLMMGILAAPIHAASLALLKACPPSASARDQSQVLENSLKLALGQGRMRLLALFFMFSAWSIPRDRRVARMMVVMPLAFFLLAFNPISVRLFATTPQSHDVWFRAFWAIPLPHFMAVGICAPLVLFESRKRVRWALGVVFAAWLLATNVGRTTLSAQNGNEWHWPPRVKAPLDAYLAAKTLVANVDAGAKVVAPERVAVWVPTFRKPVYPLYPRFHYHCYLAERVSPEELKFRRTLIGFVSGGGDRLRHPEIICFNSQRAEIDGWCLMNFGAQTSYAFSSAFRCGFHEVVMNSPDFRIWTRHLPR